MELIQKLEPSREWNVLPRTMHPVSMVIEGESNLGDSSGSKPKSQASSDDVGTHPLYIRNSPIYLRITRPRRISRSSLTKSDNICPSGHIPRQKTLQARIQAVHANPASTGRDSLNLDEVESALQEVIMKIVRKKMEK